MKHSHRIFSDKNAFNAAQLKLFSHQNSELAAKTNKNCHIATQLKTVSKKRTFQLNKAAPYKIASLIKQVRKQRTHPMEKLNSVIFIKKQLISIYQSVSFIAMLQHSDPDYVKSPPH